jgi:hypothetical protein
MRHPTVVRASFGVLLAGFALVLSACAAGAAAPSGATSSAVPTGPASAAPVATAVVTPAPSRATIQVGDGDNGRTLTVPVGSTVTLVLASTYWQVQGSSDPAVLSLVTGPTASGAGMTACVPGAGCGTVTAVFGALASGKASITAARTTCGEAMRCTGSAGAYTVTLVVGG